MNEETSINGIVALERMKVETAAGQVFKLCTFGYSRAKEKASEYLKTYDNCLVRTQLPSEKWQVDAENFFLFESNGQPKTCYKYLVRYVGFAPDYKLLKIQFV